MRKLKLAPVFTLVLTLMSLAFLSIACDPPPDVAIVLPEPETVEPSVESVLGDVGTVYPVVPDDGKTAGVVTIPPTTATATASQTPVASTTMVTQGNYKFEMSFRQSDTTKFGEVVFVARATSQDVVKVNLVGPASDAVEGPAWHEGHMDADGNATTAWQVFTPGEYLASGWLMTSPLTKFSVKLTVK
ncbi:MAG: hypothetical protein PHE50_09420 [Dehalococcoidales bacterium]|nr:hypothetical protein [Dehalococcoidales bacterium]